MDTYLCPKGHQSTESDYCSECGARIGSAPAAAAPVPAPASAGVCPDCGTPRDNPGIVFCEICGYNFSTGTPGDLSLVSPAAPPAPQPAVSTTSWTATITVDPTLHQPGSPDPPPGHPPVTIALVAPVSLIGRRSDARGIFPDLALTYDDAVSHRHALLQLTPANTLLLRDVGSSNGTTLNGQPLQQLVDYPVNSGDQITLGHWTRITIAAEPTA